jgi:UDP-glucose 4-epimerase
LNTPRAAVLGSAGFIGRHLVRHLRARGFDVTELNREQSSRNVVDGHSFRETHFQTDVRAILEKVRPEVVLNLISYSSPGRQLDELGKHIDSNVTPNLDLCLSLPTSVRSVIFFGSCEEYGNGQPPFREDQSVTVFSPYGWAKIASYLAVKWLSKEKNFRSIWLRPFLVFGPGENPNRFISSVIQGCLDGRKIPLTKCEQTRDFIYVDDVCELIERVVRKHEDFQPAEILNLSSGIERRLKDVAITIQKQIGTGELNFGALPYRSSEAMRFYGSVEKMDRLLGEWHESDFSTSIQKTIAWHSQSVGAKKTRDDA